MERGCQKNFALLVTCLTLAAGWNIQAGEQAELVGRAQLPAATFADGPPSGRLLGSSPIHGQSVPFKSQPVQGFSAVIPAKDSTFLALSDNGFGQFANSADYHLRIYTIRPHFKTSRDSGAGTIDVDGFVELSDPDKKIPFAIVHELTKERILTGADFDVESLQRVADGTLWIGDEFGPFLLHFDEKGHLLDPPIPLPDVSNPGKFLVSADSPLRFENASVRFLNAVRAHAWKNGAVRSPVYAPSNGMFGDWDTVRRSGFPVVVWTLNSTEDMLRFLGKPVDGIISDRPDLLRQAILEFIAKNPDSTKGYMGDDGLFNPVCFEVQGHRGGRFLRPESTLPAMEVALDELMTTLELDCGITRDGVAILGHDAVIGPNVARRSDGQPYNKKNAVKIMDFTAAEIQIQIIGDVLLSGQEAQKNDPALSPVSVAFAATGKIPHLYAYPNLDQLFDFVDFYVDYYTNGAGKSAPDAAKRAKNASRIRYNIETKIDPLPPAFSKTVGPEPFADVLASKIVERQLEDRADIQSFDFRTLRIVQEKFPKIRTVYLIEPRSAAPAASMLGVPWPKPNDQLTLAVGPSAGFEALGMSPDGKTLYPMLEKPLEGEPADAVWVYEFDVEKKQYTGNRFSYPLQKRTTSVADLVLFAPDRGLALERDDTQGDMDGFKAICAVTIDRQSQKIATKVLVDLMNIRDDKKITESTPGDVGLGERFAFPYWTIESLLVFGPQYLGVLNDNNFPFSIGRHMGSGAPDDTEFILLKLHEPLSPGSSAAAIPTIPLPPGLKGP